eukprot:9846298-Heterocapsa_arctica.AAC.1
MEDEKEVRKATKTNKRGSSDNEDEQYPGVSSQKIVKLRAEQLFEEAQALKRQNKLMRNKRELGKMIKKERIRKIKS